jgi:hypothetical protein
MVQVSSKDIQRHPELFLIDDLSAGEPLCAVGQTRSMTSPKHHAAEGDQAQAFQQQKVATTLGKMFVFPDVPGRKFAHSSIIEF